MSDFKDVVSFRQDHKGKWKVTRCGYAKTNNKGNLVLYLDAIPAPVDSQWQLVVTERQERQQSDGGSGGGYSQSQGGAPAGGGMDDEIPFLMDWK